MIICANSAPLSLQDQARVLAQWLKRSLAFPYEKQDADLSATMLYRDPPLRTELLFQQKKGKAAMKTKLMPRLGEDHDKELFCLGHGEFSLTSGTDQEHAESYAEIRKKQTLLLQYLRQHSEFADIFLRQEGMSDFFVKSNESAKEKNEREETEAPPPPTPEVVMGTRLFYLLCYNDCNNLWLLCHGCNITKANKETLDWFRAHKRFGEPFITAIEEAGGLHKGLLIGKIYRETDNDYFFEMDNDKIRIPHESTAIKGIGEFVMEWYYTHHQQEYLTNKELYEGVAASTQDELNEIRELRFTGDDKKADEKQKFLLDVLRTTTETYHTALEQNATFSQSPEGSPVTGDKENSPDSSTSEIVRRSYTTLAVTQAKIHWHNRYCEKEIRSLIKIYYPNPTSTSVSTSAATSHTADETSNLFLRELMQETGDLSTLPTEQMDTLVASVKSILSSAEPPDRNSFKEIFLKLSMSAAAKTIHEAKQETEKQKNETAVERARGDAEAHEKQIERERADVEAREKEAEREKRLFAERQVALLQQQLDQLRSVERSGVAVRGSGDSTQQTAVSSALGSSIKKRVFKADTTGDAEPGAEQAKKRLTGEPLLGPDEVAANEDEDINNSPTRR